MASSDRVLRAEKGKVKPVEILSASQSMLALNFLTVKVTSRLCLQKVSSKPFHDILP